MSKCKFCNRFLSQEPSPLCNCNPSENDLLNNMSGYNITVRFTEDYMKSKEGFLGGFNFCDLGDVDSEFLEGPSSEGEGEGSFPYPAIIYNQRQQTPIFFKEYFPSASWRVTSKYPCQPAGVSFPSGGLIYTWPAVGGLRPGFCGMTRALPPNIYRPELYENLHTFTPAGSLDPELHCTTPSCCSNCENPKIASSLYVSKCLERVINNQTFFVPLSRDFKPELHPRELGVIAKHCIKIEDPIVIKGLKNNYLNTDKGQEVEMYFYPVIKISVFPRRQSFGPFGVPFPAPFTCLPDYYEVEIDLSYFYKIENVKAACVTPLDSPIETEHELIVIDRKCSDKEPYTYFFDPNLFGGPGFRCTDKGTGSNWGPHNPFCESENNCTELENLGSDKHYDVLHCRMKPFSIETLTNYNHLPNGPKDIYAFKCVFGGPVINNYGASLQPYDGTCQKPDTVPADYKIFNVGIPSSYTELEVITDRSFGDCFFRRVVAQNNRSPRIPTVVTAGPATKVFDGLNRKRRGVLTNAFRNLGADPCCGLAAFGWSGDYCCDGFQAPESLLKTNARTHPHLFNDGVHWLDFLVGSGFFDQNPLYPPIPPENISTSCNYSFFPYSNESDYREKLYDSYFARVLSIDVRLTHELGTALQPDSSSDIITSCDVGNFYKKYKAEINRQTYKNPAPIEAVKREVVFGYPGMKYTSDILVQTNALNSEFIPNYTVERFEYISDSCLRFIPSRYVTMYEQDRTSFTNENLQPQAIEIELEIVF